MFFQRRWVQIIGSSTVAFLVGLGMAGSTEDTTPMITTTKAQALVDKAAQQAHEQATEQAQRDALKSAEVLALVEDAKTKATQEAQAKAQGQIQQLTKARDQAQARAAKAEQAAKKAKDEVRSLANTPSSEPEPSQDGGMDPIFDTCGEANDNGYGPYQQGVDPEYGYYDDRDDDGDVCER